MRRFAGVYDIDAHTPASITSHAPGHIDQEHELIVGLQTLYNLGPAPEPNLTVLWSPALPDGFKLPLLSGDVLDYAKFVARFDTMMDWLAKTYVDALNVIHKSFDPAIARKVTGRGVAPTLAFARRQLVWVRFVLVPGWTADPGNVAALAGFVASLGDVERVDVLPFHTLGAPKHAALGLDYPCGQLTPPTAAQIEAARAAFAAAGVPAA